MKKNISSNVQVLFTRFRWLLVLLLLQQAATAQSPAAGDPATDTFDIKKASILLPQRIPFKRYLHQIGIRHVFVPKDWTLDNVNAPMFSYEAKFGLPYGFTLQGDFETLFVSNRLGLGPFWNYSNGSFHLGIGYPVAFNLGYLQQFGFQTTLTIWEHQPTVALGYSFSKTALTLKGDLVWTQSIIQSQGGHDIKNNSSFINGYGIYAGFEQRLWKNRIMTLAAKVSNIRYHIVAWPAFPINKSRYWIPEIHMGLVL